MTSPNPSKRVTRTLNDNLEGPKFSNPDELVTIYVGPERKAFRVHKEVACLYSPVLRAAFNSNFVEGQTQTYTLEDFNTEAFQLVVQWLYRQSITSLSEAKSTMIRMKKSPPVTPKDMEIICQSTRRRGHVILAWLAADYLQIPQLQNYLIDHMEQWSRHDNIMDWMCWLNLLYKKVPLGVAILGLVFEQCVRFVPVSWYEEHPQFLSKHFLLDHVIWAQRLLRNPNQPNPLTDRAEFKRRFHVPEERNDSLRKEAA